MSKECKHSFWPLCIFHRGAPVASERAQSFQFSPFAHFCYEAASPQSLIQTSSPYRYSRKQDHY